MATYRSIATTETDPEAPVTAQLMKALEANPTAIAEAASGAPRIVPAALQTWVSRVALDGSTTPVTITGVDNSTVLHAVGFFSNGAADSASFQVSGSSDGGSSWGSWITLTASAVATTYSISAVINLKNGVIDSLYATGDLGAGPFNAIRFRQSDVVSTGQPARLSLYSVGRAP